MPKGKVTSRKAAKAASNTLSSKSTGKKSKTSAGSALSQTKAPDKETSKSAAKSASKVLQDKRTGKSSKTAAGSALSQKPGEKKVGKVNAKAGSQKGTIYGGKRKR